MKRMVEEDETTPRCSTSSGNNSSICRSSKKKRPKKVPRRALGVAQLEKMRLEEEQKKDLIFRPSFSVVCNGNTFGVPLIDGHRPWGLMLRGQQPSFSIVNLSSRTSSSTSVMNFQMELPSNQSYYKNFKPLLPEHDKVIGMKRPYPFSLDNAPSPPFP
ncbi:uncharacterized protein LOC120155424 [Hibiscus syriacus]|uniref:uncharacterized protein LOC120155424 n=1 Tax=Hibiscus syriacus TaxID=106335 RepID=UPI001922B951|nr:uncharacterized protein LOC120155424 [Hibiscus syriacus]